MLTDLQKSLVDVAERNVELILPGFTHPQVAQPVSLAHHLNADDWQGQRRVRFLVEAAQL